MDPLITIGVIAQLVERLVRNQQVRGSIPLNSTSFVGRTKAAVFLPQIPEFLSLFNLFTLKIRANTIQETAECSKNGGNPYKFTAIKEC